MEMDDVDLPDSPAASAAGGSSMYFGGRSAGFPHSSEAAALRGLGAGPSAVTRVAAAVLLREVLGGVLSQRTVEILLHGMLLPACYMQVGVGVGQVDYELSTHAVSVCFCHRCYSPDITCVGAAVLAQQVHNHYSTGTVRPYMLSRLLSLLSALVHCMLAALLSWCSTCLY